jgi:hypothetical protein
MTLRNLTSTAAEGVLLLSADPDASPLLERKEDFVHGLKVNVNGREVRCDLPPHSVAFVTVRGG